MAHSPGSFGWKGRIAVVDLSRGSVEIVAPDKNKVYRKYLGGDGLGSYLLNKYTKPGVDPMSPGNAFIISTGPLTGTLVPSTGRCSAVFKSPLTNMIGVSNAGGYLAPEIKYAGFDAVVVLGKAEKPVWLWVNDGKVEIRDATSMWGLDTWATIDRIRETVNDKTVQTLTIGPAGENLVKYGLALINHTRAFGKCGSGTVMGSKNLKAIAAKGTLGISVCNSDEFRDKSWQLRNNLMGAPLFEKWANLGTPMFFPVLDEVHNALPVRNFQEGIFPEGREGLSFERLQSKYIDKMNDGCFGCPIQCSHFLSIKDGKFKGTKIEGVEYYAQFVFGPNLGVGNWDFVIKMHEMCDRLGLQYSVGHVMAWAAELYEKGILSRNDLDGIDLTWGNEEAFFQLLEKISKREGIGDVLARDYSEAAKIIGKNSEDYQPVISRLDTSECPRIRYDISLSHLISNRGGDHNKALPYFNWLTPPSFTESLIPGIDGAKASDTFSPEGKVELIDYAEDVHCIMDSLIVCLYSSFMMTADGGGTLKDYAGLLTSLTGEEFDPEGLMSIGRRIAVLERSYNVREGFGRVDYDMSKKWYEQSMTKGLQKDKVADRELVEKLVDGFLQAKGFDASTGLPKRNTLADLGLSEILQTLEEQGKVAD